MMCLSSSITTDHYSLDNPSHLLCLAHIESGKVQEFKNGHSSAEQHYRKAIEAFPATVEGRVNLALLLRSDGRLSEEAEEHLREAIKVAHKLEEGQQGDDGSSNEGGEDDEEAGLKAQEVESGEVAQHVLAMALCQTKQGAEEADKLLFGLGYRHRLARPILAYDKKDLRLEPSSSSSSPGASALADVLDGVLPAPLLSHLQTAFKSDSVFWEEHQYDQPSTGRISPPI